MKEYFIIYLILVIAAIFAVDAFHEKKPSKSSPGKTSYSAENAQKSYKTNMPINSGIADEARMPPPQVYQKDDLIIELNSPIANKARMTLLFDLGGTKRGEASLVIDGKPIKTQKIEKGMIENNIWKVVLEMPPGMHKVKVNLKTEVMGVNTTLEEEHEFSSGKTTTLNVKIGKLSKKLSFAWSE